MTDNKSQKSNGKTMSKNPRRHAITEWLITSTAIFIPHGLDYFGRITSLIDLTNLMLS
jgi:hypothetical protein